MHNTQEQLTKVREKMHYPQAPILGLFVLFYWALSHAEVQTQSFSPAEKLLLNVSVISFLHCTEQDTFELCTIQLSYVILW